MVNCGPRMDVLDVWCVRMEDVSILDPVRGGLSISKSRELAGLYLPMLTYREALAQAMAIQRFPGAGVLGSAQTMRCNSKSISTVYAQKPSVTQASTL
jgi:hypothetical protein